MSEISELTDYQIHQLYFRPRDKAGAPKPMPAPVQKKKKRVKFDPQKAYKDYMLACLALGMKPQTIQENWDKQHGHRSN